MDTTCFDEFFLFRLITRRRSFLYKLLVTQKFGRVFSEKVRIKYINQQKFAISCCGIMKATITQMFIMTLRTRIKSPLKESETSRLSKCISLSTKTSETQSMEFLIPLENVQEIHLTWLWWILPTAEWFLHPKLQACNLITYTVKPDCVCKHYQLKSIYDSLVGVCVHTVMLVS